MKENESEWKKMKEKSDEKKKKHEKRQKKKKKKKRRKKKEKEGPKGYPPRRATKIDFWHKNCHKKSSRNWGPEKLDFEPPTKNEKNEKNERK